MSTVQTTCRHWIGSDTTGHICGKPAGGRFPYCPKHFEVQRQRAIRDLEKRRAQATRAEAAWRARNIHKLPQWRVTLERAEAELARRTASPIDDTAAYGGHMHASIARARSAALSDTNVARVVELQRSIARVQADIARAERS